MKKFITIMLLALAFLSYPLLSASTASAVDVFKLCSGNAADTKVCSDVKTQNKNPNSNPIINILKIVLNILSLLAGVAAIILLIINSLRLIVSNGDANGVKTARSGIVYVLIGVGIVLLSQTIVIYVLDKL